MFQHSVQGWFLTLVKGCCCFYVSARIVFDVSAFKYKDGLCLFGIFQPQFIEKGFQEKRNFLPQCCIAVVFIYSNGSVFEIFDM